MPLAYKNQKTEREKTTSSRNGASARALEEELAFLRQKIDGLSLCGDYAACAKMIEENLRLLYEAERWPDLFFAVLRVYQRCYPSADNPKPLEESLVPLLKRNGVPVVFASLLKKPDASIAWNGEYFRDLAVVCENREDFDSALGYIDLSLKLDPGSAAACLVRGRILDGLGRGDDAVEMFERALAFDESSHRASHALAKHFTYKKPETALEYINKAIDASPLEGSYYDTKAKILLHMGKREEALSCYDLAMEASPHNPEYPYQKAELLFSDGNTAAATVEYRKAMALDEAHIPSLCRLAALYEESQPDLALTYVNTVTSMDNQNRGAALLKAKLLHQLGEINAAAAQYRRLLSGDSVYHEALGGYAALLVHDDPAAAVEYYEKAIAIAPKIADYHVGKARAHEKLEQIPAAIKEYKTAVALDPLNARAFGRLGFLFAETKPAEAVEYYAKATGIMPENPHYHAAKAGLLMNMPGRERDAIASFNSASRYDPGNAAPHVMLGQLLERTDNPDEAVEHYKQAASLDAGNAFVFYRLARLLLPSHPEIALLHINSAISLDEANGEYYFLKSKVLNALGHDQSALAHLGESLRQDGRNTEALSELSQLSGPDSPRLALFYINRAIALSPEDSGYLCMRAGLFFHMEQYDKALAQYEDVLKRDPKNHEALFGAGRCLAVNGNPKTLDFFDKAIAVSPENAAYHAEKAAFLEKTGQIPEAVEAYGKAAALNPRDWESMLGKARLLDAENQTGAACDCYRLVLPENPDCIPALSRLGILLADSSPADANGYLSHVIELAPEEYLYRAWRGRVLLALNRPGEAAAEYQEALRLGGEKAETYFTLANILWNNLPETALGYILRAIEEKPQNAGYHLLCGKIYKALDAPALMMEQLEQAVLIDPGCHEAYENIADALYNRNNPASESAVDAALGLNPDCEKCLLLKANLLDARGNAQKAVNRLDRALKSNPGFLPAQEKLVELLEKKRASWRLPLERHKLNKMRREPDGTVRTTAD